MLATEAAQDLFAQRYQIQAGSYLVAHTSGLILANNVQNERVLFDVVDRTVYDGTKESGTNQWSSVLQDPRAFGIRDRDAAPEPIEPPDIVYTDLHGAGPLKAYRLVYRNRSYLIYSLPSAHPPAVKSSK